MNSRLFGAICAITFIFTSSIANAETFKVLSGNIDFFNPDGTLIGGVPLTGNGFLVEGVFDGSAAAIATDPSATYAGFDTSPLFFGFPIDFYYAATGTDGLLHAAPTINFNTMTADMDSIYANWNAQEFNVGGLATVVQVVPNMWNLDFEHLQTEGPFQGITSVMHMKISQVPVPAAVWLFGSGLVGLIGISRRKKVQA